MILVIFTVISILFMQLSCTFSICNFNVPGKCLVFDGTLLLTFDESREYCSRFNFSIASASTRTEVMVLRGILGFNDTWLRKRTDQVDKKNDHQRSLCKQESCCHFMSGDGVRRLESCDSRHGVVCERSAYFDGSDREDKRDDNDTEGDMKAGRRGKSIFDEKRRQELESSFLNSFLASLPFITFVIVFSLSICGLLLCYQRVMQSQRYNVCHI